MKRLLYIVIFSFLFSHVAFSENTALNSDIVKVGVLDPEKQPPLDYIAMNVWSRVATNLNLQTEIINIRKLQDGYRLLKEKKLDILLGPIKLQNKTDGLRTLNTYIHDRIVVVQSREAAGFWTRLAPGLSVALWFALAILVLLILFGGVIWLFERKQNEQFKNKGFFSGMGLGFWFALVTMTTVGYGDRVPKTLFGRIVTGVWMILTLIMVTLTVAVVTSELTKIKVNTAGNFSMSQLKNYKVVYFKSNKAAEKLILHYGGRPVSAGSIDAALKMVEKKKVVAGFLSSIRARYAIKHNPDYKIAFTDYYFPNGEYVFLVRENYPYALSINSILFSMSQTNALRDIEKNWLNSADLPYSPSDIR